MKTATLGFASALVILMSTLCVGARASATTIDFEGQPSRTQVGSTYASLGVTFDFGIVFADDSITGSGYPAHSGTGLAGTTGQAAEPLNINFASPVSDVSLWYSSFGDFTFNAYDAGGNLIDSVTGSADYGSTAELALNDSGISYVSFSNNGGGAGFDTIDDLSFTPAASPVPEPSNIALLGTGILGVAGTIRRRLVR